MNARVRDRYAYSERIKRCDILTLFAQADGQLMLVIYDLITRAADTSDDSWIDRFTAMTYEDLLDSYDMAPTDAKKKAARDFDDDARTLLENWEDFRTLLLEADDAVEEFNAAELPDDAELAERVDALTADSDAADYYLALAYSIGVQAEQTALLDLAAGFTVADYQDDVDR